MKPVERGAAALVAQCHPEPLPASNWLSLHYYDYRLHYNYAAQIDAAVRSDLYYNATIWFHVMPASLPASTAPNHVMPYLAVSFHPVRATPLPLRRCHLQLNVKKIAECEERWSEANRTLTWLLLVCWLAQKRENDPGDDDATLLTNDY